MSKIATLENSFTVNEKKSILTYFCFHHFLSSPKKIYFFLFVTFPALAAAKTEETAFTETDVAFCFLFLNIKVALSVIRI